tara:strand:+ start:276 stop:767 length:492 start_codon:yes stop_codon:yes gene_type:complete
MKKSISLIGMAGAGKSSLGNKLAKHLDYEFIDSDLLIEKTKNKSLQKILDEVGTKKFKEIEEAALLSVKFNKTILATGGSAIFSEEAMYYIKKNSSVIYIEVSLEEIVDRVSNFSSRGFVKESNQTIQQAFNAREEIYKNFSDHIVSNNRDLESCFKEILGLI